MTAERQAATTAAAIATALLAGPWRRRDMVRRVAVALGQARARTWVGTLVGEVQTVYPTAPVDRPRELARIVRTTQGWERGQSHRPLPRAVRWEPVPTALAWRRWPVADLPDQAAVARLLDVDAGELAWFADARRLERTAGEALRHYRWRVVQRPSGVRLLAAPKPRLKEAQRRVLRRVLDCIPVHDAAHGCVPGRSVRTAVAPHAGSTFVLRMDLEAFFASVAAGRVHGLLLGVAGLPEPVAHVLTGLVTTVLPTEVWRHVPAPDGIEARERHRRLGQRLAVPHLPQGAPTSPALANLVCHRLDRRLTGLAMAAGATYTRYVDDLTFSGDRRIARDRFAALVTAVVEEEGFQVNAAKTSATSAARRQSVLGTVVNDHPTLPRPERDALRALLHNCAVHGWTTQTRGRDPATFRDHVLGRVAWAASVDPGFGARLHGLAERIDWSAPPPS
ncbi:reverse transcriptase family protein [Modestobacter sp. VKM Ac-2983]|uniref:reverse transcriptase family protein n=1 Tax=Modestobacter sp. VKM Ac-2983 TaxID=3004137 RepID=UPI0022AB5CF6|nr:reverse transcriptase family protein [Modestobacter sp. VKM Ac-2983]MCZ2804222.1 reverse transcriptase family protein [Modestobacter sp. VKM Ac-2983]